MPSLVCTASGSFQQQQQHCFPSRSVFWSVIRDTEDPKAYPSVEELRYDSVSSEQFLIRLYSMGAMRNAIECLTRGQTANDQWFRYRKFTITGSKAHILYNAGRRGNLSPNARSLIIGERDESKMNFAPVRFGRECEPIARWNFIARKMKDNKFANFVFQERGLYLDQKFPFIAASVDGLYAFDRPADCSANVVADDDRIVRLLEIKCAWSIRDIGIRKGAERLRYLSRRLPGNDDTVEGISCVTPLRELYELKKSIPSYFQSQLYLRVYGIDECTLLIWTPIDFLELQVPRDDVFGENLFCTLNRVYCELFIPTLLF